MIMLSTKQKTYNKYQKSRTTIEPLSFGQYRWNGSKTIEAVRPISHRHRQLKLQEKVWIRFFPDIPVIKKTCWSSNVKKKMGFCLLGCSSC